MNGGQEPRRSKTAEFAAALFAAAILAANFWAFLLHPSGVFVDLGNDQPLGSRIYLWSTSFLATIAWSLLVGTLVVFGAFAAYLASERGTRLRPMFRSRRFVLLTLGLFLLLCGLVAYAGRAFLSSGDLVR